MSSLIVIVVYDVFSVADTVSKTNGGTFDGAVTFSQTPVGAFISEADQFRLTADLTSDADPISSNLERVDDATFAKIGTGMSVSSGTFTFPSTGLYLVRMFVTGTAALNDNVTLKLFATQNNSAYDSLISQLESGDAGSGSYNMSGETFVNVTDTSNVKVQFQASSINSGSTLQGDTNQNKTYFTFIKLGASQ